MKPTPITVERSAWIKATGQVVFVLDEIDQRDPRAAKFGRTFVVREYDKYQKVVLHENELTADEPSKLPRMA